MREFTGGIGIIQNQKTITEEMRGPVAFQPLYVFVNLTVKKRRITSAISDANVSHA
jgi:hypothetical protein